MRAKRRRAPTIHDVAEAAGVSKSTVSNVIRESKRVSAATEERVRAAIARVGYRPNAVARNLVSRRTSTLGIVVGDLANLFYSELAKLVEVRLAAAGYAAMICNTDGRPEDERDRIESLLEHRVAGLLLLQFSGDRRVLGEMRAEGVPHVVVSCWEPSTDCVAVDDARGAALAAEHLVELGHRRIAYLSSGLVEQATDRARFRGFRRALERAGLPVEAERVLRWEEPAYLRGDGELRARLERLLAGPRAPTGFFVTNDLVAIDLVEALEELGLRVPADVSVVGFDDIALAGLARVSLTTVAQPREELARIGVELVLRRVEGADEGPPRRVRLKPTLVVRRSTASPQGATRARRRP